MCNDAKQQGGALHPQTSRAEREVQLHFIQTNANAYELLGGNVHKSA